MNIQISQKLAAVAMAIIVNGALMGGVAYLFSNNSGHPISAQRFDMHEGAVAGVSAHASLLRLGAHRLALSI